MQEGRGAFFWCQTVLIDSGLTFRAKKMGRDRGSLHKPHYPNQPYSQPVGRESWISSPSAGADLGETLLCIKTRLLCGCGFLGNFCLEATDGCISQVGQRNLTHCLLRATQEPLWWVWSGERLEQCWTFLSGTHLTKIPRGCKCQSQC